MVSPVAVQSPRAGWRAGWQGGGVWWGVSVGGSGGEGGQPAADMTQDPQSKQSFQTDYHSCLFEEG